MIWYQNLANFGTLREKSHKCSFSKILIILQIKSKNLDHLLLIYDQLKKENNIIVSMHPNDFKINSFTLSIILQDFFQFAASTSVLK